MARRWWDLISRGRASSGTAVLTLANGAEYLFTAAGRAAAGQDLVLRLSGAPTDPAAKAIRIKSTVSPLEAGWARLEGSSATGYGQSLSWLCSAATGRST